MIIFIFGLQRIFNSWILWIGIIFSQWTSESFSVELHLYQTKDVTYPQIERKTLSINLEFSKKIKSRMAATLCNYIFVKPCQACGKCCDEFSKCCAEACECCRPCWEMMENFCERPFAATLSFIFLLVFAPALAMVALAGAAFGDTTVATCRYGDMPMWGIVFALICFVDFGVAIYIFCKFNEPYDFNNPKDRSFTARTMHLLCTDCVVALYICVLLFKFIWLIMGSVWVNSARLQTCPNGFSTMIEIMQILGWFFFCVGFIFILWQWFYVTCCPKHADAAAQKQMARQQQRQTNSRSGSRGTPQQQNMTRNQEPTYQQPTYQQGGQQQHIPVATAQPVGQYIHNNNQRGAVQQIPPPQSQFQQQQQPQVVVHQPARTANAGQTGAAKKEESTAGKLFGKAKGLFGR